MSCPARTGPPRIDKYRHTAIGLGLAACVIAGWLVLHVGAIFFYQWGWHSLITAPIIVALGCWLYVGLFIVSHDCMHGSLAPFRPKLNAVIGKLCMLLYAGFDYDRLNRSHHRHHRYSGTEEDPDFDFRPPHDFGKWYLKFLLEYFGLREFAILSAAVTIYIGILGVGLINLIAFWTVPAILSSLQLFYFGTYLPHCPGDDVFTDRHRTRSTAYNWWFSLLTCFHFGYHHEHHLFPEMPWWRLPEVRQRTVQK
ncbi:MAG: fatty acid desaturase [Hyphomicrobiaceae bacterium]